MGLFPPPLLSRETLNNKTNMNVGTETFYALDRQHGLVRVNQIVQRISDADTVLKNIVNSEGRTVRNFARSQEGVMLSVNSSDQDSVVWGNIPSISISCGWEPSGDLLVPDFRKSTHMRFEWTPPEGVKVFFVAHVSPLESGAYRMLHALVFAAIDGHPGAFRLPLPNTYDSCEICLGESRVPAAESLSQVWSRNHEVYRMASYNTDLLSDHIMNSAPAVFAFSKEGYQSGPTVDVLARHCVKAGSTLIERVQL